VLGPYVPVSCEFARRSAVATDSDPR